MTPWGGHSVHRVTQLASSFSSLQVHKWSFPTFDQPCYAGCSLLSYAPTPFCRHKAVICACFLDGICRWWMAIYHVQRIGHKAATCTCYLNRMCPFFDKGWILLNQNESPRGYKHNKDTHTRDLCIQPTTTHTQRIVSMVKDDPLFEVYRRKYGVLLPPLNQQSFKCYWALGTTAVIEGLYRIKTGRSLWQLAQELF